MAAVRQSRYYSCQTRRAKNSTYSIYVNNSRERADIGFPILFSVQLVLRAECILLQKARWITKLRVII